MIPVADGTARSVLFVDDDEFFRRVVARALQARGYSVRTAADYEEALAEVSSAKPDFSVVDYRLSGRSGLELVRAMKTLHPTMFVLMLTGSWAFTSESEAMRAGADRYLRKPVDVDEIVSAFPDRTEHHVAF